MSCRRSKSCSNVCDATILNLLPSARLSKTLELHQLLQPQSDIYVGAGWSASFRSHVEQVGSLVKEAKLEELVRQDLNEEWNLVHKAVLYTGRRTWIR